MSYFCPAEDIWMLMMMSVIVQFDQDFLENMEDFVTLDELAEDEDEAGGQSDTIGTWRFITELIFSLNLSLFNI